MLATLSTCTKLLGKMAEIKNDPILSKVRLTKKVDDFILKIKQDTSPSGPPQDIIIISDGSWSHTFQTLEDYKQEVH